MASIAAIKYGCKYVSEGLDRIMAKLSALSIPEDAKEAEPQAGGSDLALLRSQNFRMQGS